MTAAELRSHCDTAMKRRQLREDHVRVAMAERLMGWDPTDDANYDLVINTGMYSLDEAVDVIVRAYRSKYQT